MPANTATKRITLINAQSPWRTVMPPPDGTIAAADRVAYGYQYAFESSVVTAGFVCIRDVSIAAPYATGVIARAYASGSVITSIATATIKPC